MPICGLIDDWEPSIVAGKLALTRSTIKINHYWIANNMMGLLMEDIQAIWRNSKDMVLEMCVTMEKTVDDLISLEDGFEWGQSMFDKYFDDVVALGKGP